MENKFNISLINLAIQLLNLFLVSILLLSSLNSISIEGIFQGLNRVTHRLIIRNNELKQDGAFWINELIKGGYIVHIRHADRIKTQDIHGYDFYENQLRDDSKFLHFTCLSDEGKAQSQLLSWAFSSHNIAFTNVYTSPSCRAIETTQFISDRYKIEDSLMYLDSIHQNLRDGHKEKLKYFFASIDTDSASSFNTLLVGHEENVFPWAGFKIIDKTNGKQRLEGGFSILKYHNESNTLEILYTFSSVSEFIKSSKTSLESNS